MTSPNSDSIASSYGAAAFKFNTSTLVLSASATNALTVASVIYDGQVDFVLTRGDGLTATYSLDYKNCNKYLSWSGN